MTEAHAGQQGAGHGRQERMATGTPASRPLVGLDAYSLTGPSGREISENDGLSLLQAARSLGADGLQAGLPDDAGRREEAFALAAELGLYLEPYAPLPLHWRNDQAEIERRERRFHEVCAAASRRGIQALHCTMGARERFEDLGRWKEYVEATARCLCRLAPELRDLGLRLGLEN